MRCFFKKLLQFKDFNEVFKCSKELIYKVSSLKNIITITVVFSVLSSLFQLFGLALVVPVLNGIVDPNNYEALLTSPPYNQFLEKIPFELSNKHIFAVLIGFVLICSYLENIFLYFSQAFSAKLSTEVSHRLRVKVFQRYLRLSKSFYDRANLGEMQTLLTSIITGVGQHYHFLSQLLVVALFSLAFLVLMLFISWKLTLIAMIMLPLTHFMSIYITKNIRRSAEGEVSSMIRFSERALDVLDNVLLTKLSSMEEEELDNLSKSSKEIQVHGESVRKKRFLIPRVVDCINTTGTILLASAAVFIIFKVEALSIGRLSVFFISLRRFTSYIQQIFLYWGNLVSTMPLVLEVLKAFEEEDKTVILSGSAALPKIKNNIQFNGVSFSYQEGDEILKDLNLKFEAKKLTAIIGPTGSGKSTILNMLPRFLEPSKGEVLLDGQTIETFDLADLRNKISYVSQKSLILHDTLRNNLTYGLKEYKEDDLEEALKNAGLYEFIQKKNQKLETKIGKNGVQLSGGERQRLALARAFLRDPEILLLDEATSALDAETEHLVQAGVEKIIKDRTTIVVAHRMSTIKKADHVFVISDGKIKESGSPKELLKSESIFKRYAILQNMEL